MVSAVPARSNCTGAADPRVGPQWADAKSTEANVESESLLHKDEEWWTDPSLMRVNVVVCTATSVLEGTAYRMPTQRLLDAIVSGFVANSYRFGKDFMSLTDVLAHYPTGQKVSMASTQISKSRVLFVAERCGGQPDKKGAGAYQLRAKKPVLAMVYMPPYMLMGKMHAGPHQKLVHVLEADGTCRTFLAMTNICISPPLPTGESAFSFVAINKREIVHTAESPGGLQMIVGGAKAARPMKRKVAR